MSANVGDVLSKASLGPKTASFSEKTVGSAGTAAPVKKPYNPWERYHNPPCAAAVLTSVTEEGGEKKIRCEQFPIEGNGFYRTVHLSFDFPAGSPSRKKPKTTPKRETLDKKREDTREPHPQALSLTLTPKKSAESSEIKLTAEKALTPRKALLFTPTGKHDRLPCKAVTDSGKEMNSERSVEIRVEKEHPEFGKKVEQFILHLVSPPRSASSAIRAHSKRGTKRKFDLSQETLDRIVLTDSFSGSEPAAPHPTTSAGPLAPSASPTHPAPPVPCSATSSSQTAPSSIAAPLEGSSEHLFEKRSECTKIIPFKRTRSLYPRQNTVKGTSAAKAMAEDLVKLKHEITINERKLPKNVVSMLTYFVEHFPIEWLHHLSFKLTPAHKNPQTPENLSCAGSWINTAMMPVENVALFFAELHPGAVEVEPTFLVLNDADIILEIHYRVRIQEADKTIELNTSINALTLPNRRTWPSCSDADQIKHVVTALLNDEKPRASTTFTLPR